MASKKLARFTEEHLEKYDDLPKRVKEEVDRHTNFFRAVLLMSLSHCESPIEQLFYISFRDMAHELRKELVHLGENTGLTFSCQDEVLISDKKYRLDFSVSCYVDDKTYKFAIECDGHEFHEKTKEQAARDKQRERNLTSNGYIVIRFTGSELWKNPFKCASETYEIISNTIGIDEFWQKMIDERMQ